MSRRLILAAHMRDRCSLGAAGDVRSYPCAAAAADAAAAAARGEQEVMALECEPSAVRVNRQHHVARPGFPDGMAIAAGVSRDRSRMVERKHRT